MLRACPRYEGGILVKKLAQLLLLVVILAASCRSRIDAIPTGTWKYRLLVNGAEIGSAVISNELKNGLYVSTTEMAMDAGYIRNSTRQIITETADFKPVKLEVYNVTEQDGQKNEMVTIATFSGNRVNLDTAATRSTITIEKPFILEGNYFMQELIKRKFKEGTVLKNHVYEPSVDVEEPMLVMLKVLGREKVPINGKNKNLIHLGYSIENLKNIDLWMDEEGVTQKTTIVMLNNKLELILQ
jgi:hypothetical protein